MRYSIQRKRTPAVSERQYGAKERIDGHFTGSHARRSDQHALLLSNLLELYVYDLSEIFSLKLGADGHFGYDKLPLYWSEPDTHFAYLIRSNDELAGFALVTRGSPATDDPDDLDLAEFFVLRSYRRAGIGRRAAFLLWDGLPARWVVRVSELNREGLSFWDVAIRGYTRGAYRETKRSGKSHMFRVFSFTSTGQNAAI